jgi:hypothetical protein
VKKEYAWKNSGITLTSFNGLIKQATTRKSIIRTTFEKYSPLGSKESLEYK